ncbi:MAG: hypothetical protein MJ252_25810, partial [archaeon]|nr:hypothetical protein [archaeon]
MNRCESCHNSRRRSLNMKQPPTIIKKDDRIHLNFYYCNKCHHIPKLTLNNQLKVDSKCDKCSQPYKSISLEDFCNEINKTKVTPYCKRQHFKGTSKLENYCSDCNKWLCNICLIEHKEDNPKHNVLLSDGLELSSNCSSP